MFVSDILLIVLCLAYTVLPGVLPPELRHHFPTRMLLFMLCDHERDQEAWLTRLHKPRFHERVLIARVRAEALSIAREERAMEGEFRSVLGLRVSGTS